MATAEKIEEPQKNIQDKGIETKDVKNAGDNVEPKKNEVVSEKVAVEEKKNEAEKEGVVVVEEKKKKNNEVENGDVSESNKVEKSSTMPIEEKGKEPQKDKVVPRSDEEDKKPSMDVEDRGSETKDVKSAGEAGESKKSDGVIEKVVMEEEKKSEGETREIVVEDKRKEGEVEEAVSEENKSIDRVEKGDTSESTKVEKISSFRVESDFFSDLKEHEKRALMELRTKIENAILGNKFFKANKGQVVEQGKEQILEKVGGEKEKTIENETKVEENPVEEPEKAKESSKNVEEIEEKEKILEKEETNEGKGEENFVKEIETEKENSKKVEEIEVAKPSVEEKSVAIDRGRNVDAINKDVALWGVPLLPSKGDSGTDVILLKFLRAREFEVSDAFEMLRNTLKWRKDNNVDSILDEDFGDDLGSIGHMNGVGREGHPVCYSNFKLLGDEEAYNKILGTEENREMFIRQRVQLMEKAIQKLDFKPGGVSSILLVNDLKDMPGPSKKELRLATKQVVGLLQDNYPEFVARNIFINVPFWYYAFSASALLLPFLTPRTNSKVVFARPSRVTDVLLKFIAAEQIPVHYGGLKRETDSEFSTEDAASEVFVNQSSSESIQIPAAEAGTTLMWEVTVLGWEVNYKEEFFPTDEGSYGIIVQKGRRIGVQEGSLRNSFTSNEPGNVVLTVENGSLMKKKRVCYRYKIKNSSSS